MKYLDKDTDQAFFKDKEVLKGFYGVDLVYDKVPDMLVTKALEQGAIVDTDLIMSEYSSLPLLVRKSSKMCFVPGAFKEGTIYGIDNEFGGLIPFDFTRNTIGTYFDKDGVLQTAAPNVPRISFNVETGECMGYKIEAASTNLLRYSQDLTRVGWNGDVTATLNTDPTSPTRFYTNITKPTGLNSASVTQQNLWPNKSRTSAIIFCKADTSPYIGFKLGYGDTYVVFNYSTKQFSNLNATADLYTPTCTTLPDGWLMITLSRNITRDFDPTENVFSVAVVDNLGNAEWDSQTSNTILVAGVQFELRSVPTSYIPTEAVGTNRGADYCINTLTPEMYPSIAEGSIYGTFNPTIRTSLYDGIFSLMRGAPTENRLDMINSLDGLLGTTVITNGLPQPVPSSVAGQVIFNQNNVFAYSFKTGADNLRLAINNNLTKSTQFVTVPIFDCLQIGGIDKKVSNNIEGYIKNMVYFNRAITDDELLELN